MNCREHQEFFSDLYDGNLPPDRRRELESHLASCPECRAEYGELSESLHALREGAVPVPGDPFVHRVVETVRSETERIALFQNTGVRRPTTRGRRRPGGLWALPAIAARRWSRSRSASRPETAGDQVISDLLEQLGKPSPGTKFEPRALGCRDPRAGARSRASSRWTGLMNELHESAQKGEMWVTAVGRREEGVERQVAGEVGIPRRSTQGAEDGLLGEADGRRGGDPGGKRAEAPTGLGRRQRRRRTSKGCGRQDPRAGFVQLDGK
jgi:hypothetical protein